MIEYLNLRNFFVVIILVLPVVSANSAPLELSATEKEWIEKHKEITVYSGTAVPPFMFPVKSAAEAKGIAIDYVKAVLAKIGITPRFSEPMSFADARKRMEQNEGIDLLPLATGTPETSKRWALTTPFYSTPLMVFTRKEEGVITEIEQYEGRNIAYFKNARFVQILKNKYKDINWVPYPLLKPAFEDVASGKVDGVIAALTVGAFIINENGLSNLKVAIPAPFPRLRFTFAVHKDNTLFATILSKGIDSLSPQERSKINNKWLPVRFDHGLRFADLAISIAMVVAVAGFIIFIVVLTNRRLKSEISARKRVEDELIVAKDIAVSANVAKSQFLTTMSHELRTPLTSISGTVSLAQSGVLGELNEKGKTLMQAAHKNCERLQYLINDLLDMEKVITGRLQLILKRCGLEMVLHEAIELNQSYAEKYNVSLSKKGSAHNVFVMADIFRLSQVVTNLISNACKFSTENGEVVLRIEVINDRVRVSVENQGEGIAEKFRPHVFEKFSQADMSDTRSHTGSGLGLAISKEIIESMNGTIGFDSEPGNVTSFYFELPIVD